MRKIKSLILIFFLLIPASAILGFPGTEKVSLGVNPDGRLMKLSGWVSGQYTKATPEANVLTNDYTRFGAGVIFPINRHFTVKAGLLTEFGDTTHYLFSSGLRFYAGGPVKPNSRTNSDGTLWSPIIDFEVGYRLSEKDGGDRFIFAGLSVLLPVSEHLSLGGGGYYYDKDDIYQSKKYYTQINFHPKKADSSPTYFNPDGVIGIPSFYIRFGGSENGIFGRLDLKIPLDNRITVSIILQGERTPSPYVRHATIGAAINFYPR